MDATTTEEGYVSNVNRTELLGKIGENAYATSSIWNNGTW